MAITTLTTDALNLTGKEKAAGLLIGLDRWIEAGQDGRGLDWREVGQDERQRLGVLVLDVAD